MAVRRPRLAHHGAAPPATPKLRDLLGVIGYARRALGLVWTTSRAITVALAVGSVLLGLTVGDVFHWANTDGSSVQVRVLVVVYQPEAEGDWSL